MLKAAVVPGSTQPGNWAAPLSETGGLIAAFLDTLKNVSVFDTMLPDMKRVPLRTRVAVTTLAVTGHIVGEGAVKPISTLELSAQTLEPVKALAIVVITKELIRFASGDGADLFGRELRNGVGRVTDQEFISIITTGVTPISSSGETAAAIRADIAAGLDSIVTDASSRLYLLVESRDAKALAAKSTTAGDAAFPEMTPQGGIVCGMPALVCDGLADRTMVIVDANGIAAGAGTVEFDTSEHSVVEMQTTPTNPTDATAALQSLSQQNKQAIKAVRYFGAERLRDSVAVIDTISYSSPS